MKKVRRFAEGGNPRITDDVRERARMFAMLADDPEAQAAFQRSVHRADQAAAEKLPPPSPAPRSAPAGGPRPAPSTARPTPQAYSSDDFDAGVEPAVAAARLNAMTRGMRASEPAPTRTPNRDKAAAQEREGLKSLARGIERTDKDLEEARAKPRSTNVSAMGERAARQMEEKGSIYSKDFGKPKAERMADRPNYPTAERLRGERRKRDEMVSRQEREERDTGAAMNKSSADTRRREAKQDRPNYPTAERLREERRKRDELVSRQEREERDTGAAMNTNAASARRKEAVKGMRARQEQEEKDTGIGMRKTLIDTERREAKQDRPNYPTERRVIDERRKRILGTDRPRMFKRKDEDNKPRPRSINAANPDNFRSGGAVGSASKRADGIASKGKTRGRIY